jgi:ABC-type enterochelin transport system permease subunit
MFKVFNVVFGLIFVACAALQWNDPDLYLWIALYLAAALSCACAYASIKATKLNLAIMAIYAVYAGYLFVAEDGVMSWMVDHHFASLTESMLASAPWIENSREFGGLFIMLVVCAINLLVQRNQPDPSVDEVTDNTSPTTSS